MEAIISDGKEILKSNQCKDTSTVIEWFTFIPNQRKCPFNKFNIVDFYPSISADFLNKPTNFPKLFVLIEGSVSNTIKHAHNLLPLEENGSWLKKHRNPLLDITTGSFMVQRFVNLMIYTY